MGKFLSKIKNVFSGKMLVALTPRREKVNKVIKYSFCFGLPLLGAILGSTLGIIHYNKNKNPNTNIVVELKKDEVNRRVYLISNDNLTIPLSVSLEKKSTLQEQILDVYNLLKVNSKVENDYVKGYIPEDIKMNKMEIKDKILSLDFDNNILNESFNQNKILEALTMSFVSFDEIDGVEIYINGTKINEMFTSYIPDILDENYGINQDYYYTSSIIGKEKQIVFYNRTYAENYSYMVPVTVYCDKAESVNQTFVNATRISQPVSSHLKKIDTYKALETYQNGKDHTYSITTSALVDEDVVNKQLYDLVSLSYDLMGINEKVSFTLEGEAVSVDGIYNEEDSLVSEIIYNSVKL